MKVLVITNNKNSSIKLISFKTYEEAINAMKDTYENLCFGIKYDFQNTFMDEDSGYAQVVVGLEQIELRIGKLTNF